jgi:hypothetical protein
MEFVTKSSSLIDLHVVYKNKEIANTCNTKFLGLTLDNTFSWKNNLDTILFKLSSACFAVRAVKPFLSQKSLKMAYFYYFHSIMTYRLVFWGNSYYSNTVFKLQKKIIRIMVGIGARAMQSTFQKTKNITIIVSIYILTLIVCMNNKQHFKVNSEIHNINTRNNLNLHYPQSHLTVYQKGMHYTRIKISNKLHVPIKQLLHDTRQF